MSPLLVARSNTPPATGVGGREEKLAAEEEDKGLESRYHFLCNARGLNMLSRKKCVAEESNFNKGRERREAEGRSKGDEWRHC